MLQQRTQIYLEPSQHAALLKEARRLGISLAAVIRSLVNEHLLKPRADAPSHAQRIDAALSLIGLGAGGAADVSENVDKYSSKAIEEEVLRDRRAPHRKARRKAR